MNSRVDGGTSESKPVGPEPGTEFRPAARPGEFPGTTIPPLLTLAAITAILYLGKDIFLPIAVALLLTFALAPIVSFLRRRGLPKILAVVLTVTMAFSAIAIFLFVVGTQVTSLAQNIPAYQTNIVEKVRSLREMGASGGLIDRLTGAVERVGEELSRGTQTPGATPDATEREPLPVEIVERQSPIELVQNVLLPLISPFATAGLVIVVVIFMLLEREALRDRFIRLAGYSDLHRTTEAIQDAGTRVGRYLLMQLVVNTLYAIPIALGLWLLGIPNALLWGLLTLVLRFVPYIGPAIGMILPMVLTLAVTPGWAPLFYTGALFLGMELLSNNVMEPWLYGSRTGLSPLAIIVSAIFWAWLWGPLGLVLSTPLTVCLVVLGRHVPQFEFFNVLFGNEPVLEQDARLYQRLLAGDPDEAADNAEEYLEDNYLVDYYARVGIPALLLAEQDRQRGVMTTDQIDRFASAAQALVADLEELADEDEEKQDDGEEADTPGGEEDEEEEKEGAIDLPDGEGRSLVCAGGRGPVDDAAAAMMAHVLRVQDATVTAATHTMIELAQVSNLQLDNVETLILVYLNAASSPQARYAIRRLRRAKPGLRIGVFVPLASDADTAGQIIDAERLRADFVAHSLAEAVRQGLAETEAVTKLVEARSRRVQLRPRRPKPRQKATADA